MGFCGGVPHMNTIYAIPSTTADSQCLVKPYDVKGRSLSFTGHSYKNNSNGLLFSQLPTGIEVLDLRNCKNEKINRNLATFRQKMHVTLLNDYEDSYNNIVSSYDSEHGFDYYYPMIKRLNERLYGRIPKAFSQYMKPYRDCKKKIIMQQKAKKTVPFYEKELITRYHGKYVDKIEARARYLCWKYRRSQALLLTFTYDPKKYDYNIPAMWEDACGHNSDMNRIMTLIRKACAKRGTKLEYISTVEAMHGHERNDFKARGIPHIHVCLFGIARLMDYRVLRELWGKGFIFINRTDNRHKVRSPVDYITKYIVKTYSDKELDNELNQGLTWIFNTRMFNSSRGLVQPLNDPSTGEWESCFVVSIPNVIDIRVITQLYDYINLQLSGG